MQSTTVLFVHGTGVRRGSYISTYNVIQQACDRVGITYRLDACLWGDALGAASIVHALPDTTLTPDGAQPLTREEDYARWEILTRDPLFELRLLKNRPAGGPRPPSAGAQVNALWHRIRQYELRDNALAIVRDANLETCWASARTAIVVDDPTAQQATTTATEIGEPAEAVARAIVAQMLDCAFNAEVPQLDRRTRDALVNALVDHWEARVAGKGAFLLRFFGDMVATVATPVIKWRRGPFSESANPAAGDILCYQARPHAIRAEVRNAIAGAPGDVYLLAHSLGGIICVDLLALESLPKVKGLVTVGSQAPYLCEIGALLGIEPGTTSLPAHFPRWLNLYDPYDFLSYVAEPVFGHGVTDQRIESGQPFPYSHSAYWTNPDTWTAIKAFLS